MPPKWSMLPQILTPAICLPLEKGLFSPTPTNQECCAVIQHCSLSFFKEIKEIRFHRFFMCYSCLNERLCSNFPTVIFCLIFVMLPNNIHLGIHLGNTRKGKCWKAIDLPGGKLHSSFSFPELGCFFQLEKQHIILSVKFWNHKIVL